MSARQNGLGFRQREAQQLVEAARTRMKAGDGRDQLLRCALAAVPAPAGARESVLTYVRTPRPHARAA